MAPRRKHTPPTHVPELASWALRSEPSSSTKAATADAPKAIEPTMFSVATDQSRSAAAT